MTEQQIKLRKVLRSGIMTEQQIKLRMGIVELKKCYIALKELEFSNDVLDDIADMVDDLESLKES